MNLNIVSTYCYQSVTLSHRFHPVDGKGCTLHRLSGYTRGFHHSDENR